LDADEKVAEKEKEEAEGGVESGGVFGLGFVPAGAEKDVSGEAESVDERY